MQYTEDEIKSKYNHASNKKEMIQILADLNACDEKVIESIVGYKKPIKTANKAVIKVSKMDLSVVNGKIKIFCNENIMQCEKNISELEDEIKAKQEDLKAEKEILKQWNEKIKEL